jgi:hypothetical protein
MSNLIVNSLQSMSAVEDGNRDLHISTMRIDPEGVRAAVRDTGLGCARRACRVSLNASTRRSPTAWAWASRSAFDCRSHRGRLRATRCEPRGALFQFTTPLTKPSSVIDVAYWQPRGDVRATPSEVNHDFALRGAQRPDTFAEIG